MFALRFLFVLVFCSAIQLACNGQSILNGIDAQPEQEVAPLYTKVMVIPFEDKMYLSDADRDIAKASAVKDHGSIKGRFRDGLMISLTAGSKQRYACLPLHFRDSLIHDDLVEAFSAIKYKYEPVPVEKKKSGSIFKTVSHKPETKVEKGQIVSQPDPNLKYMKTVIKKTETLHYLAEKYEADLFLFISQFEIKNDMNDPNGFAYGNFNRNVRVHYTFYNQNSEFISGGIAEITVPADVKEISHIISGNFSELAGEIFKAVFKKEKENEEAQNGKQKITPKGYKE